ncbi:hypothetical protein 1 [Hubei tombus-like virus 22]|uniref:hypothetical protein 1 n=1 Tax=Hubei tombus-like virus 22 TaxID=1923269 RepID=UPI00090B594D|nr:hypothetical protein 1 [Hubei tombus-like virus 22]APG76326.1 hypothetical protein 1 [Hubei tombus-like virus 22]
MEGRKPRAGVRRESDGGSWRAHVHSGEASRERIEDVEDEIARCEEILRSSRSSWRQAAPRGAADSKRSGQEGRRSGRHDQGASHQGPQGSSSPKQAARKGREQEDPVQPQSSGSSSDGEEGQPPEVPALAIPTRDEERSESGSGSSGEETESEGDEEPAQAGQAVQEDATEPVDDPDDCWDVGGGANAGCINTGLVNFLKAKLAYKPRFKNGVLDQALVNYAVAQAQIYMRDHPARVPEDKYEVFASSIMQAIRDISVEENNLRKLELEAAALTRHTNRLTVRSKEFVYDTGAGRFSWRYWFPKASLVRGVPTHPIEEEEIEMGGRWVDIASVFRRAIRQPIVHTTIPRLLGQEMLGFLA